MKKTKIERSNDDNCLYALGMKGVNEKSFIEPSKAFEIISSAHDKCLSTAKSIFFRAVDNELLVKVSDSPAVYCFSKDGLNRFNTMRLQETILKGADTTFEEFIRKYYLDAFYDCVRDHRERIDIKYHDIEKGLGIEFADSIRGGPEIIEKMNDILKRIDLPIDDDFRPCISIVDIGKPYTLTVEAARNSIYFNKLIEVEGRIMTQSKVRPRFLRAGFKCLRCEEISYINQKAGKWAEPFECDNDVCRRKGPFELRPEDSVKVDSQDVTLESEVGPANITVKVDRPLCTSVFEERDAKIVKIVGVLEIFEINIQNKKDFDFVLTANSITLAEDGTVDPPTPEEMVMFEEWAKEPKILREKLIQSVAPHIHGKRDEKDALSLALFSDWTWNAKAESTLIRSSLHVLIIGDPGTAKSQLLSDIAKLAPKAIQGQGENSTGRGLSNSAVEEHGIWVIKAGLFAKADRGIVCLDELDKVDQKDLVVLNSILVSQKQIVDKAGMHVTFNTRCAALCGANPKSGHLDRYLPVIQQLGVSSFLFQRFDIIFVNIDVPNKENDGIIYDRIHELCNNASIGDSRLNRPIHEDIYKKYVMYARTKPQPKINKEADDLLKAFYISIRNTPRMNNEGSEYPAISARSAAALNKLTIAIARREMAPEATIEHARYALALYKSSIISMGLSGEFDMMVLENGGTQTQFQKITMIRKVMTDKTKGSGGLTLSEILQNTGYLSSEVASILQHLKETGDIIEPSNGKYRWC